MYLVQIKQH